MRWVSVFKVGRVGVQLTLGARPRQRWQASKSRTKKIRENQLQGSRKSLMRFVFISEASLSTRNTSSTGWKWLMTLSATTAWKFHQLESEIRQTFHHRMSYFWHHSFNLFFAHWWVLYIFGHSSNFSFARRRVFGGYNSEGGQKEVQGFQFFRGQALEETA